MANRKTKEQQLAKELYVKQLKTAKEIGEMLDVSENTVGKWIESGNWKRERDARKNNTENYISNLLELIGSLTEKRIALEQDPEADPETKVRLADEVAKWNKALETAQRKDEAPLAVKIKVMEEIFSAMQHHNAKLWHDSISFQEFYLNKLVNEA